MQTASAAISTATSSWAGRATTRSSSQGPHDVVDGGTGTDTISFERQIHAVTVSLATTVAQDTTVGQLTQRNAENLTGTPHADVLTGNTGPNVLNGGGGDDRIAPRGGNDHIDGGAGIDTLTYVGYLRGVTVSLAKTGAQSTGAGTIVMANMQKIVGTSHSDVLYGTNGANSLDGGSGNDRLYGRGGDDRLYGRTGADRLCGGTGNDDGDGGSSRDTWTSIESRHNLP